MKIDKIISENHNFPLGTHRFAALSSRTLATKKCKKWIKTVPSARARTRSLFTGEHIIVLERDLPENIKAVAYGYLEIK